MKTKPLTFEGIIKRAQREKKQQLAEQQPISRDWELKRLEMRISIYQEEVEFLKELLRSRAYLNDLDQICYLENNADTKKKISYKKSK